MQAHGTDVYHNSTPQELLHDTWGLQMVPPIVTAGRLGKRTPVKLALPKLTAAYCDQMC